MVREISNVNPKNYFKKYLSIFKKKSPLKSLKNKILFDLILNEQNNSLEQEFAYDSLLYLFNINFESNNQLLIDLYDNDGKLTGAQIRIDIEIRWFEFSEPIEELKEIKERIRNRKIQKNTFVFIFIKLALLRSLTCKTW